MPTPKDTSSAAAAVVERPEETTPPLHELTGQEILEVDDTQLERVEVPEWGGYLFIKGLTGQERDAFETASIETRGKVRSVNMINFRARLIALCARNSKGDLLFTRFQIEALGKKSARALERVFSKAQTLSGLGDSDVEQLTQELGKDQNDDSGSVLPLR